MSTREVVMIQLFCDGCGTDFEYEEETGSFQSIDLADFYATQDSDWSTDGDGKHHCGYCPALELSEAGKAARARKLTDNDIPLDEVAA
jgi:hypothetical protein